MHSFEIGVVSASGGPASVLDGCAPGGSTAVAAGIWVRTLASIGLYGVHARHFAAGIRSLSSLGVFPSRSGWDVHDTFRGRPLCVYIRVLSLRSPLSCDVLVYRAVTHGG